MAMILLLIFPGIIPGLNIGCDISYKTRSDEAIKLDFQQLDGLTSIVYK